MWGALGRWERTDALEDGGRGDEGFHGGDAKGVGALFDGLNACSCDAGSEEVDVDGLVGGDFLQVAVEGGVEAGGGELGLGELERGEESADDCWRCCASRWMTYVGETFAVEFILEVFERQSWRMSDLERVDCLVQSPTIVEDVDWSIRSACVAMSCHHTVRLTIIELRKRLSLLQGALERNGLSEPNGGQQKGNRNHLERTD